METQPTLGLVAGNGVYPEYIIRGARAKVPGIKIVTVAFKDETSPVIEELSDVCEWFHVGQISKPFSFLKKHGAFEAIMAGGLNPKGIFNLRPDLKALIMMAKLKKRNADSIFTAIADAAAKDGITILPSTTHMEDYIPEVGIIAGPKPSKRQMEDALLGMSISKEVSRLNIGQVVILRHGTILAVEALEGTNACINRGASIVDGKETTMVKIPRFDHDMRFDVPVVGPVTLETCAAAGVKQVVVEAGKTILLQKEELLDICQKHKISFHAISPE